MLVTGPTAASACCSTRWRSTPPGRTTLDAWMPDLEGRLLAYQLSAGGDEHRCCTSSTSPPAHDVEPPIDRCRYSSVAWLPGGAEFVYVRMVAADEVPAGEQAFHRRVWRHRVGTPTERGPADRRARPLRRATPTTPCTSPATAAGWWSPATSARPAATASGSATCTASAAPLHPVLTQADDVQCSAWVERDGLLYLRTTDGAPRWRLAVTDPAHPGREHWRELVAEDPDSVLDGVRRLEPAGTGRRCSCWPAAATPSPSWRCTTPPTARRAAPCRCPDRGR